MPRCCHPQAHVGAQGADCREEAASAELEGDSLLSLARAGVMVMAPQTSHTIYIIMKIKVQRSNNDFKFLWWPTVLTLWILRNVSDDGKALPKAAPAPTKGREFKSGWDSGDLESIWMIFLQKKRSRKTIVRSSVLVIHYSLSAKGIWSVRVGGAWLFPM